MSYSDLKKTILEAYMKDGSKEVNNDLNTIRELLKKRLFDVINESSDQASERNFELDDLLNKPVETNWLSNGLLSGKIFNVYNIQ